MADKRKSIERSEAEAQFFGHFEGEEIDPELVALAHGPNALMPFILILLSVFAAFLMHQYRYDASYYFAKSTPTPLGDVITWHGDNPRFERGQLVLPENRYVALEGVTQRRALIAQQGYAKLVGVPVFAEVDAALLHETAETARTVGQLLEFGGDRHIVAKPGRLISFSKLPIRYSGVASYLSRTFEVEICGVDTDPELIRALRAERERRILQLHESLGRPATEEEIVRRVGPECQEAWLFQEGVAPSDHRGFLIGFSVLSVVLLLSLGFLGVWIKRYRDFYAED